MLYAYPAVLSEGANLLNSVLPRKPLVPNNIYSLMKRNLKTMINYSNFDISTNKRRQITVAFPLMVNDQYRGGVIWETQQLTTFKEIIIPKSLYI